MGRRSSQFGSPALPLAQIDAMGAGRVASRGGSGRDCLGLAMYCHRRCMVPIRLERTRLMPFVETLRSAIDKVQGALPAAPQWEVARLVSMLTWIGVPARLASAEV